MAENGNCSIRASGGSSANNAVRRYDGITNGDLVDDFIASSALGRPLSLVRGPDGKLCVSALNNSVLRLDGNTGAFLDVFVPAGCGGLSGSFDMAFGPDVTYMRVAVTPIVYCDKIAIPAILSMPSCLREAVG